MADINTSLEEMWILNGEL